MRAAVELLLYGFVSTVCGALNFTARILLAPWLGFHVAVAVSFLIASLLGFMLVRTFVFHGSTRKPSGELWRFYTVQGAAFVAVFVVSSVLYKALPAIGWSWHSADLAHMLGISSGFFVNFLGNRQWTFRSFIPTRSPRGS